MAAQLSSHAQVVPDRELERERGGSERNTSGVNDGMSEKSKEGM